MAAARPARHDPFLGWFSKLIGGFCDPWDRGLPALGDNSSAAIHVGSGLAVGADRFAGVGGRRYGSGLSAQDVSRRASDARAPSLTLGHVSNGNKNHTENSLKTALIQGVIAFQSHFMPNVGEAPQIVKSGGIYHYGSDAESGARWRWKNRLSTMWKTSTALIFLATAAPAQALQPLHEDPTVVNGFYWIGLADEVQEQCDAIEPRIFRAIGRIRSLERYAREAGYSRAQIDELADNKVEKRKLRARIRADLAKRGATPETPEGYCTVGLEEIAKGSAAGRLLRAK